MLEGSGSPRLSNALRTVASIVTAVVIATPALANEPNIFGTWLRDDGNARVRVAPCGAMICATNIWIRDPVAQKEKVGDRLEFTIKQSAAKWTGEAYDPQRKLNFSATLAATRDTMTTKGCMVKFICRTTSWQRL